MANCPFCQCEVDEDLVRFGGNCGNCLIEIPGEEAPTDHGQLGEVPLETEITAMHRKQQTRIFGTALVAASALLLVVFALKLGSEGEVLTDDGVEIAIVPLSEHEDIARAEPEPEPVLEAEVEPAPTKVRRRKRTTKSVAVASKRAVTMADPLSAFGPSVGPRSRGPSGVVLDDMDDIKKMVKRVLGNGEKQLTQCYNRALNGNPDLVGTWRVQFVITAKGAASKVVVRPVATSDVELEACFRRNIMGWSFQAIAEPLAIDTRYSFSPS
jgi:hypothetical protein